MTFNTAAVRNDLVAFATSHQVALSSYGRREAQTLELAALLLAVTHYERSGYAVAPLNAANGEFKVKLGSRGLPWNFSYWRVERDGRGFEIHANLATRGADGLDDSVYVVDVGVIRAGAAVQGPGWRAVENSAVVSFIEAKRLVVYPMLLAQFVGIVHEIKPEFLAPPRLPYGFRSRGHFFPVLAAIGYLHHTARSIVTGYERRRFFVNVEGHCDVTVARLAHEPNYVPLGP